MSESARLVVADVSVHRGPHHGGDSAGENDCRHDAVDAEQSLAEARQRTGAAAGPEKRELDVGQHDADQRRERRNGGLFGGIRPRQHARDGVGETAADDRCQDPTAPICWYFPQTGVPPRASPTPMIAPVTVNAVAMG